MEKGFQGKQGQAVPEMTDNFVEMVSKRYQELFKSITGKDFQPAPEQGASDRIFNHVESFLTHK